MYVVCIEAVVAVVSVLSVLSEVSEVSAGKGFLADHFKICETYRSWESQEARFKLISDQGVGWTKEPDHFLEEGAGEGGIGQYSWA